MHLVLGRLLVASTLLAGLAACGESAEVETVPLPDGIVMHLDQSRVDRKGREVFLRVENGTREPITVTAFTLTSERLETVRWRGEEEVGASYETDLELTMPTGRCGTGFTGTVRLTYRVGDGPLRRSTGPVDDPYGAASLFMDRDCAQAVLTDAASLDVGEPTLRGTGRESVLTFPVTFTPTGRRPDVRFVGFEPTRAVPRGTRRSPGRRPAAGRRGTAGDRRPFGRPGAMRLARAGRGQGRHVVRRPGPWRGARGRRRVLPAARACTALSAVHVLPVALRAGLSSADDQGWDPAPDAHEDTDGDTDEACGAPERSGGINAMAPRTAVRAVRRA
jgi:hypothetical protein